MRVICYRYKFLKLNPYPYPRRIAGFGFGSAKINADPQPWIVDTAGSSRFRRYRYRFDISRRGETVLEFDVALYLFE